jgi:hypothetical protein
MVVETGQERPHSFEHLALNGGSTSLDRVLSLLANSLVEFQFSLSDRCKEVILTIRNVEELNLTQPKLPLAVWAIARNLVLCSYNIDDSA